MAQGLIFWVMGQQFSEMETMPPLLFNIFFCRITFVYLHVTDNEYTIITSYSPAGWMCKLAYLFQEHKVPSGWKNKMWSGISAAPDGCQCLFGMAMFPRWAYCLFKKTNKQKNHVWEHCHFFISKTDRAYRFKNTHARTV